MILVLDIYLFGEKNNFMDAEKVRSIRLPEYVWDALDADAARCRRSSQKQIEAILVTIYKVDDVELDKDALASVGERAPNANNQKLELIGELAPNSKTKLPLLETKNKMKRSG